MQKIIMLSGLADAQGINKPGPYIMGNARNLMFPNRIITNRLVRVGSFNKMIEQTEILHGKCGMW